MQEAHGDDHRPGDDEVPEQPRLELRLDGEGEAEPAAAPQPSSAADREAPDSEGDDSEGADARPPVDAAPQEPAESTSGAFALDLDDGAPAAAPEPEPSEPAAAERAEAGTGSHGFVGDEDASDAPEEEDVVVDGGAPALAAVDAADPAAGAATSFEVDDDEVSQAIDEVLVFQMDEDEGPHLPEGVEDTEPATYSELHEPGPAGVDHDEFSELGETWEARLNGEDDPFAEPAPVDRRRQVALAAGAGALIAIVMFAFVGDDATDAPTGDGVDVARRDAPTRSDRTAPNDASGAPSESDPANASNGSNAPDVEEPREPREPRAPRSMVAGLGELFAPMAGATVDDTFVERDPSAVASLFGGDQSRDRREGYIPIEEQVVLPGPLPNLQMADASAFANLWLEDGLPPGGVNHASYLQTPVFGDARVHTSANEFFDGRLVGLGAGRLALSTRAGELTLAASQVESVERLVPGERAGIATLVARTTGERVRVRAAGGWLRGEVVREDRDTVTLLLESGGRITVDRSVVRPANEGVRPRLTEPPVTG